MQHNLTTSLRSTCGPVTLFKH